VDVFATSQAAGATTVVGPSLTPAYANDRLLIFEGARGTFSAKTWTPPSGTGEEVQVNSLANVSAGLADQALGASGATGTRTSTFGASANLTTIVVAIPQPPSVLFYQTDQLGSTRLLTDSAGLVRGTFSYDAYGNLIGSTGAYSSPLGWSGQYRDSESGLVYLRARYYDPTTAQFLTRDPLLSATRSPYGYVADNPLTSKDPSGLSSICYTPDADGTQTYWVMTASGLVPLFRAVSADEAEQLLTDLQFQTKFGMTEGKYFFPTQQQAFNFGQSANQMGSLAENPYEYVASGAIDEETLAASGTAVDIATEGAGWLIAEDALDDIIDVAVIAIIAG
jgi:RHS repeat-associated protein